MALIVTFNNFSVISVLLLDGTWLPRQNNQSAASPWKTLSRRVHLQEWGWGWNCFFPSKFTCPYPYLKNPSNVWQCIQTFKTCIQVKFEANLKDNLTLKTVLTHPQCWIKYTSSMVGIKLKTLAVIGTGCVVRSKSNCQ